MSTPHLSRSNSAIRGASSTPQPNGIAPIPVVIPIPASKPWIVLPASTTNYPIRIKSSYGTMLVVPAVQASTSTLPPRSARRGQTTVNYAEDDDDEYGDRGSRDRGGAATAPIIPEEVTEPVSVQGKPPSKALPWRRTPEQQERLSELPEVLIPVNYERDIDATKKIRERFTWNLYEGDITFERFARQLCIDLDLDPRNFVDDIVNTIRTACQEWAPIATLPLPENFVDPISGSEGYYLVNIKLNVQCGVDTLTDQFMYNLYEEDITPEDFALQVCHDIGYHGEYQNAVASAIREELLKAKKEMFFPSGQNPPPYNWKADAHPNHPGIRYDPENFGRDWSPNIEKLTREEVERKEIDRERETRRLRRETTRLNPVNTAAAFLYGTGVDTPGTPATPATDSLSRRKRAPMIRDDSPMRRGSIPAGGQNGAVGTTLATTPVPLPESMMGSWKCSHCKISAGNTWGVRDGPDGRFTLCAVCGLVYYEERKLPHWRKGLFDYDLDLIPDRAPLSLDS
ncbi:hypothetical protein H072_10346 [Dactylellina haptotyla CBS 200.50]|uniref:GATA-type domain-containing protein n=1 Tax=Dactylellina haptotyla (strain CBS 200.50) TaxID=1284197 RepID=S7ZZQ0_DACHA|nr:hypothetical protein H072_10346 [Dactylellina haptotyla CBS 200.50]